MKLETKLNTTQKLAIITLHDAIDHGDTSTLSHELKKLYDQGFNHFVLELSDVPYISSLGLAILMDFNKQISTKGTLRICTPSPDVLRLLKLMDLTMFQICDSLTSACEIQS
jgi:stage II sporulation protein AA (anti-sigma F factor antagonist)